MPCSILKIAFTVHGLDTTTKQIKNIFLRPALAEYQGGMKSFPIYPSITSNTHQDLFETWSVDPVPMPITSIEGYFGYFSFVEKSTKFRHVTGYKQSATIDLINALDILINKYGPRSNRRARPMRVLILDAASTHLSDELHQWCENRPDPSDPIIHRNVSVLEQGISRDHSNGTILKVSTWCNSKVLYRGEF